MSAVGAVIGYFEDARQAETDHNYLLAARCFLLCDLYYQNGELPFYDSQVKEYGESSKSHYWDCYNKLSLQLQQKLKDEYIRYHHDWHKYADYELKRISDETRCYKTTKKK